VFQHYSIQLKTTEPIQIIDITDQVKDLCKQSKIQDGLVLVASSHTTAGVRINEKCEKLEADLKKFLTDLVPPGASYQHNHETLDGRNNAHSHLLAYLMGSRETVAIEKGQLRLGGWQSVFFVELDGPRSLRNIEITIVGE